MHSNQDTEITKCQSIDEWLKKICCVWNGIFPNDLKEANSGICDMIEPGRH
jgi:hypothetical protein